MDTIPSFCVFHYAGGHVLTSDQICAILVAQWWCRLLTATGFDPELGLLSAWGFVCSPVCTGFLTHSSPLNIPVDELCVFKGLCDVLPRAFYHLTVSFVREHSFSWTRICFQLICISGSYPDAHRFSVCVHESYNHDTTYRHYTI